MQYKNILVIRNDKIGDFILSWPALALLKKQYPETSITALVPRYTAPLAEVCPWIDHCLIDDRQKSFISDILNLQKKFRHGGFNAVITLFSEFRTGIACWLTGIPIRVAPATKIAQIFYNNTLVQHRSKSEKPEFSYNIDLAKYFIKLDTGESSDVPAAPYLTFDAEEIKTLKDSFKIDNKINASKRLIFIHPGTGGSAINLSLEQYSKIAIHLSTRCDCHIIITAGPDELEIANELSKLISDTEHTVYHSTGGIIDFSKFLSIADLFISGSTGPLHITGALNRPTVAFYPARRSATPLRWQTLNQKEYRLAITPDKYTDKNDMQTIDPITSADNIIDFYQSIYHT